MHDERVPKRVAYLVKQYPKVSHTFIRREIRALEERGIQISRVSVRDTRHEATDDADREEAERTTVLLEKSAKSFVALGRASLASALKDPRATLAAARTAVKMGLRSDRGPLVHLAYLAE